MIRHTQAFVLSVVSFSLSLLFLEKSLYPLSSPQNSLIPAEVAASTHKKEKGFSISINGSPFHYLNTMVELFARYPQLPLHCLPSFREGERISVTITGSLGQKSCQANTSMMSAKDRIALGIRFSVNDTTQNELEAIPGIGERTAQRIIEGRPWTSITSLSKVKGLSRRRVMDLSQYLSLSPSPLIWQRKERK